MSMAPNGVETVTITGSNSSVEKADEDDDIFSFVKEEEVDSDNVEFNHDSPKPVEGLHEMGPTPTPFLKKTFEMVDDVETDTVVSWSLTRTSFIVWDSYKLSEDLLPKYFKHNNFSSFLRQLNIYGFRKVSDRWEFANEGFQGGKKHLLKNIKRRRKINCNKDTNTTVFDSEIDIESLKEDQSSMTLEMMKLNQQQEESSHQMITMQDKIHGVDSKLQHMINFFKRLSKDQSFVERLMTRKRRLKRQRELETTEFVKMLKLLYDQETQGKVPCVESDLIIRQDMPLTATQTNLRSDITMNNENENPKCLLNTEAGAPR